MPDTLLNTSDTTPVPITLVAESDFEAWRNELPELSQQWVQKSQFRGRGQDIAWLPDAAGAPTEVAVGWDGTESLATLGGLPFRLPEGVYALTTPVSDLQVLGWALGAYRFSRYKDSEREPAQLLVPEGNDASMLADTEAAITLVRDLINIPAGDMTPSRLADEAVQVAETHGAEYRLVVGDELLKEGYGAIHAVGRAAADAPRMVDISWGDPANPAVTLVGKGVCFDSGGLNIKPASGMRTMKKDMGGAAHVLGLAALIMSRELPVRLRVLVAAVENAISGNAYRPGDVLETYKGISVEIDNTDAEGRLVMCDCLALAAEQDPALIIDYSTLTGSARSAVGAEIAAMFCNDDDVANALHQTGQSSDDPLWRMPLHQPYRHMLKSNVADTVNSAASPYAGAITAALFLEQFVSKLPWVHFDIMAYNVRSRPGHPEGGEAMGVRAVFDYLSQRFAG
ncbi:MAG: leucyl aminopeptidase [Gammaproteobacteria bacterium]|nr:leucyl aminopeptidase [Gammaproteobacteria bacterium]